MVVPMVDLSMQIGSYAMGASDEVTDGTKSYGKPNKMGIILPTLENPVFG